MLGGRGGCCGCVGRTGNSISGVVEEMPWSHAVVLVIVTLAMAVVDAVVDAELRAVVDTTTGIFDLQVVDALLEISLGIPGE